MFTGVIKLAQIDDYISPSQNCIQPKIMKKDKQEEKATVTLNDCLACSGCITSAQSILIQQMSIEKFMSMNQPNISCQCKSGDQVESDGKKTTLIITSPQAILSLAKYYQLTPDEFLLTFESFLNKKFNQTFKFFSLNQAIHLCHEMIFQQFIEHFSKGDKIPIICSQCPGWVCYAEKTLTKQVTNLMSKIKSPQQIAGRILRKLYNKNYNIVSIAPCYDKKLQAIRFQIQAKIKQVDLTLASVEVVQLINKCLQKEQSFKDYKKFLKQQKFFFTKLSDVQQKEEINFLVDQSSNGYIHSLINKLGGNNVSVKEIRNADFQEFSFQFEGKQIKMAKCYGFRNIQKIVQPIKKNKCIYQYIQMMACPGGCFSGGGQIRYENIKNKQIVQQFKENMTPYLQKNAEELPQSLRLLMEEMKQQILVSYSPIQKTLEQSVMNW